MTAEEICKELNIDYSKILNIYPDGLKRRINVMMNIQIVIIL